MHVPDGYPVRRRRSLLRAGVLGAAGAAGLTWALSRFAFDMTYRSPTVLLLVGVAVCGVTVSAVGVVSSWDVLQRRPLSTLRGR